MDKKVVTRMPPSPSGLFHVGSVRTALYNYLFAKQNEGKFILRIEDTDKERSKKEFEENIVESFAWLGLPYQEFYRQSERTEIYKKYLQILLDEGLAYVSKEKPKEEDKGRERAEVIRFKNPNKKIKFTDLILGGIEFDTTELKDFVIAKDLDTPLYHLAVVVDDMLMGVSHVIRGQDLLANTPRQILILEALGGERPKYAHVPLIFAPDKSKLSKRHGAVSALEYREMGYLPAALLNFVALIGWNPGTEKEIFTLAELLQYFSLEKIQKSGGVFNTEKLDWINKEHIKRLPPEEIEKNILANLPEDMRKNKIAQKLVPLILERVSKWGDVRAMAASGELDFFFQKPDYPKEKLIYKNSPPERIANNLKLVVRALENLSEKDFTVENLKNSLMLLADAAGVKGEVLHPVRFALSGRDRSPDPFLIASILGKDETISRLQEAI